LLQITLAMNFLCKALLPVLWSFRKEPSAEAGRESWRVQMRRKSILLAPLILLCLCSGLEAQQLWSGILAANRATDWTRAGVQGGIPQRATICATLSPGVSAAQISRAISSCPANQVVFLSAGTYELSEQITFGTRSNVTLRGAGADQTILRFSGGGSCSGLPSTICVRSAWVDNRAPPNSSPWVAGYAPGTTQISVGSTAGMKVGGILILDQFDDSSDSGGVFICANRSCAEEGGNSPGRRNRGQQQLVKVVALSGNRVTISSPIRMPNWRASQSPGVFWSAGAPVVTGNGIEDLTVDLSNARGQNGVVFLHVSDCWAKGIRTINAARNHYWLVQSMRITVRDSYLYGGQGSYSTSYGVEDYSTGDNLIENNIFQHVTAPLSHNGSNTGSVFGYNFAIDDNFTADGRSPSWMVPGILYHEVGISHLLHEGNDGLGALHDGIHGTTHFNTLFRNHFYGDVWNDPPKLNNTAVINIAAYGRYFNITGNVLGRTGYYTTYESNLSGNSKAIFAIGWSRERVVRSDPLVKPTMFRWGNYDTVNGAVRFVAAEVPTALSEFGNFLPAGTGLPPSFYLSSKPAFFGSVAWPPIGPDVKGGTVSGWGGHANKIPARLCFENTAKTDNILNFNAAACYGPTRGAK
jgi:hypothetical protein